MCWDMCRTRSTDETSLVCLFCLNMGCRLQAESWHSKCHGPGIKDCFCLFGHDLDIIAGKVSGVGAQKQPVLSCQHINSHKYQVYIRAVCHVTRGYFVKSRVPLRSFNHVCNVLQARMMAGLEARQAYDFPQLSDKMEADLLRSWKV